MTSRRAFGLALLALALATGCPAADLLFGQPCGQGLADCPSDQVCDPSADLCRPRSGDGDEQADGGACADGACSTDGGPVRGDGPDAGVANDGGVPPQALQVVGDLTPGASSSSSGGGRFTLHGALSPSVTPLQSAGGTYTLQHLELAQP